jgi:hypothetical protein
VGTRRKGLAVAFPRSQEKQGKLEAGVQGSKDKKIEELVQKDWQYFRILWRHQGTRVRQYEQQVKEQADQRQP